MTGPRWDDTHGGPTHARAAADLEVPMKTQSTAFALTCALGFAVAGGAAPQAVSVWPVDALVKVFPVDRPPSSPVAEPELVAARNQHVSLQVALRSSTPLEDVS